MLSLWDWKSSRRIALFGCVVSKREERNTRTCAIYRVDKDGTKIEISLSFIPSYLFFCELEECQEKKIAKSNIKDEKNFPRAIVNRPEIEKKNALVISGPLYCGQFRFFVLWWVCVSWVSIGQQMYLPDTQCHLRSEYVFVR